MSTDPDLVRCVPVADAASRLNVGVRTLYDMEKRGEIHISRVGRKVGVALYEIMRVLDLRRPVDGPVDVTAANADEKIKLFPQRSA